MNVFKWLVVTYFVIQTIWLIARVGRRRPVITPAIAAAGVIEFAVVAILVVLS